MEGFANSCYKIVSPILLQKLINDCTVCKHYNGTLLLAEDISQGCYGFGNQNYMFQKGTTLFNGNRTIPPWTIALRTIIPLLIAPGTINPLPENYPHDIWTPDNCPLLIALQIITPRQLPPGQLPLGQLTPVLILPSQLPRSIQLPTITQVS